MSFPTSSNDSSSAAVPDDSGVGEFMLFGVRVVVDSMRKSVSLNNLSQYEQPQEVAAAATVAANNNNNAGKDDGGPGYASDNDVVHNSGGNRERERKRGVPWTEEEHKLFLLGLQKVGKGDWRGISRNFVKSRTPTQVASHAQKYFLRRTNHNRRRRRSSLFDITTDTVTAIPMEEEQYHNQDNACHSLSHPLPPLNPEPFNPSGRFSLHTTVSPSPIENLSLGQTHPEINNSTNTTAHPKLVRPIALHSIPHGTTIADFNLNLKSAVDPSPLSLKLALPTTNPRETPSSSSAARYSAFQSMSSFANGDSFITVA
ncbi:transcription factor MYB1R1 [Cannabis sativa]|uniref:transcription factor MYB1R1 n=1 Tax=Cannabis sativa TaxID=3483 RepID=UPI0029CA2F95|nr:transcription factor MYB1R1 [Cannabis sativa]